MNFHCPRTALTVSAIAILGAPSIAAADQDELDVTIVRAPIAPDGTTAGAPTDFVLTFRDRDPDEDGIAMQNGGTFTVVLPPEFTDNGPAGNIVAVLQGWPQSVPAPPPAFIWTTEVSGNTITATMTEDWPIGTFGPGPKQVHLITLGFLNPTSPGQYRIPLSIDPDGPGGAEPMEGVGRVRILRKARPSVNVISLFSGPPGPPPPFFNPVYQELALGETGRQVGIYLWDADSVPFLGVDLEASGDPSYYRLVQNGSKMVGDVRIEAPDGAENFSLDSVALPPGGPPSVEIPAFVTGAALGTTTGLLGIQLTPDPTESGEYEIEIRMIGGNREMLFVEVGDDDDDSDSDSDD